MNTFEGYDIKIASAKCGDGEFITGGGFRAFGASRPIQAQIVVTESLASYQADSVSETPTAWTVLAQAPTGIGYWGIDARAICASRQ